jgi:hypothetical protein
MAGVGDMNVQLTRDGEPILDQFSADGFVDCTFRIASRSSNQREHRLHLSASHRAAKVGFDVVVVKGIRGAFDGDLKQISEHVYPDGVRFLRSGPESDRLMTELAKLHGLSPAARKMVDSFDFTALALHQDDVDMESQPIKLKLFGNDEDSPEDYFESFLHLALSDGFVFWNEKDLDYRHALMRGLSLPDQNV